MHQPPGRRAGDLELRWAGLRAHNRWLADFCADGARPARPASPRSCCTTSTRRSPRSEWAAEAGLTGGVLLPGAPPGSGLAAALRAGLRAAVGGLRGAGLPINHHSGSAVARLRRLPRSQGHVPARGRPGGPTARCGTSSSPACWSATRRCSSSSPSRAPRGCPRPLGTLDYYYARMGSAAGSQEHECGADGGGRAVAASRASTGPASATSGSSFIRRHEVGAAPRRRRGQDHVGQRLPAPRGLLAVQPRGSSGSPSPACDPTRSQRWSAATRPASTASTSTRWPRSRPGSDHRTDEVARPLGAERDPRRGRCGARPSPASPPDRPSTTGANQHEETHGTVRYAARSDDAAAQPRGEGDLGRRVGDHAGRHLPDRSRGHRRGPAAAASSPATEPLVQGDRGHGRHRPGYPPFGAGSFSVRARHEGTDGYYALLMPMTTEQSVIGGRETFGEPKKLGPVELARHGRPRHRHVRPAWARRSSRSADGSPGCSSRRGPETRTDFYFKFLPAPDGKGFDSDPALVYCHRTEQTREARSGHRRGAPARVAVRPGGRPPGASRWSASPWPSGAASSGARSWDRARRVDPTLSCTSATTTSSPAGRESMEDLDGRVAVVTGGAGGIGARHGRTVRPRGHEGGAGRRRARCPRPLPSAELEASRASRSSVRRLRRRRLRVGGALAGPGLEAVRGRPAALQQRRGRRRGRRRICGTTSSTTGGGRST